MSFLFFVGGKCVWIVLLFFFFWILNWVMFKSSQNAPLHEYRPQLKIKISFYFIVFFLSNRVGHIVIHNLLKKWKTDRKSNVYTYRHNTGTRQHQRELMGNLAHLLWKRGSVRQGCELCLDVFFSQEWNNYAKPRRCLGNKLGGRGGGAQHINLRNENQGFPPPKKWIWSELKHCPTDFNSEKASCNVGTIQSQNYSDICEA